MDKLKMEILNERNEVVNSFTDQKEVVTRLLSMLWSKYINKATSIKRISYNYNYSDVQKITFTFDNKFKYVFSGIPTSWGSIEDYKIITMLNMDNKKLIERN